MKKNVLLMMAIVAGIVLYVPAVSFACGGCISDAQANDTTVVQETSDGMIEDEQATAEFTEGELEAEEAYALHDTQSESQEIAEEDIVFGAIIESNDTADDSSPEYLG